VWTTGTATRSKENAIVSERDRRPAIAKATRRRLALRTIEGASLPRGGRRSRHERRLGSRSGHACRRGSRLAPPPPAIRGEERSPTAVRGDGRVSTPLHSYCHVSRGARRRSSSPEAPREDRWTSRRLLGHGGEVLLASPSAHRASPDSSAAWSPPAPGCTRGGCEKTAQG